MTSPPLSAPLAPPIAGAEDCAPVSGLTGAGAQSVHWCRMVRLHEVDSYLARGWTIKPLARSSHGAWSALAIWPSVYPPPEED